MNSTKGQTNVGSAPPMSHGDWAIARYNWYRACGLLGDSPQRTAEVATYQKSQARSTLAPPVGPTATLSGRAATKTATQAEASVLRAAFEAGDSPLGLRFQRAIDEMPHGGLPRQKLILDDAANALNNGTLKEADEILGEGIHRVGKASFVDLDHTGIALRPLSSDRIRITHSGTDVVEQHLSRFTNSNGQLFGGNVAMLRDLRRIADGEILSTKIHRDFYAHEMREFARFRVKGFATKPVPPSAQSTIYRNAHYATLKEYGIPFEDHHKLLYTPFAQSVMFK